MPVVLELGGKEYAELGDPPNSTGTRVFSLSGNVRNGGNYELEVGTTLRELIYDIGGGIPDGRELKAIIPGGSSVPVLTPDQIDTPLDADSMAEAGSLLGSGGVIVIDDRCCMVQLGLRVAQFYMHESCGKCTPCREGTRWMVQILHKIEDGRRGAVATSTSCSTSAIASSASACARSATPPPCRSRATSTSSAPSSRSTSTPAAAHLAASRRSRASSPRSSSTRRTFSGSGSSLSPDGAGVGFERVRRASLWDSPLRGQPLAVMP